MIYSLEFKMECVQKHMKGLRTKIILLKIPDISLKELCDSGKIRIEGVVKSTYRKV